MNVVVTGAGGFIGGHLVKRLIEEGYNVRAIDKKPLNLWYQKFSSAANIQLDLSSQENCLVATEGMDWVFNLAADMGGMGFIESNKALCMLSVLINTNLLIASKQNQVKRYFFSSSACVYASWLQSTSSEVSLKEEDAYPADPEDGYGWEKLFSERMCRHFSEDFDLQVRIARYHNVYGPYGTYEGGREKAPAAACRKLIQYKNGVIKEIEIWGDGKQTRSFTYIDDCIEGTLLLMKSNFSEPLNIGSSEIVTIQNLYDQACLASKVKDPVYSYKSDAPLGVRGRSSNNTKCLEILSWAPKISLKEGMVKTMSWISQEITNDFSNSTM
jgi:nucleoside-diphosphate-sugar epimerase